MTSGWEDAAISDYFNPEREANMTAKLTIDSLMLTDERRQSLESCHTLGGYEGKCDPVDTICRDCLAAERAAIANAVIVLGKKGLLPVTTDISLDEAVSIAKSNRKLLAEAREIDNGAI